MKKYVKKKVLHFLIYVICITLICFLLLLVYLTMTEYKPEDLEQAKQIKKTTANRALSADDSFSITTYNIGYCNDSQDSDFFMDGGRRTRIESINKVERNMKGISENLKDINSDINLIQEVDTDSKRGYHTNQAKYIAAQLDGSAYYATNFSVKYIPYPIPDMIGKVESGLLTVNPYAVTKARRRALPVSFKYPVRICQMKRCLLEERIPIKGTTRELVLINLHLEAYDSGEGKEAQARILNSFMKSEYNKGNYVIAGGDFNQLFPNADNSKYPLKNDKYYSPGTINPKSFSKAWTMAVDDSVPTSRLLNEEYDPDSENTQYYVIDGFILSPNLKLEKVKTIDTKFNYSDHNPVRIDVTFRKDR